jgi:uncharacterized membrane protein
MCLVILYHTIGFILVVMTYYVVKNNYDKLPEKIPIHFGLTMKANQWAKKSKFSAFFLFYIGLALWIFCLALTMSFIYTKGMEPVWFFAMYSVGLSFMNYYTQLGITKYTLGEIKTITSYILTGSAVFLISIIIATCFG